MSEFRMPPPPSTIVINVNIASLSFVPNELSDLIATLENHIANKSKQLNPLS